MWFFGIYNEMCQCLEDLHNSVNQNFSNDQLQCYKINRVKDSFKTQDKLMNFSVTECKKFIDRVSDSVLQLIFKKLPHLKWLLSSFSMTFLCEVIFFSYTPKKMTCHNRFNVLIEIVVFM